MDGFHRHLIGKSRPELSRRLHGYLPVTLINAEREGQKERIAATIRHNRAGQTQIAAMSDIVRDLHRRGWDDRRIGEELGMDADEVLRLKQISGLTELFADESFSEARPWSSQCALPCASMASGRWRIRLNKPARQHAAAIPAATPSR